MASDAAAGVHAMPGAWRLLLLTGRRGDCAPHTEGGGGPVQGLLFSPGELLGVGHGSGGLWGL